jgi:hypothetical protein
MTIQMTPLVYSWVRDLQIDDKYIYLLRDYSWCLDNGRPVTGNKERADGSRKLEGFKGGVKIHQLIMYLEHGRISGGKTVVRHLNHNVLDNRLENLAFGTARQNSLDHEENTGVNQMPNRKWHAKAYLGDKYYSGTCRKTEEEALADYTAMVKDYEEHGILPKTLQERKSLPKYIKLDTRKSKPYLIRKHIYGRTKYFGYYATLDEAVDARDKLIAVNWIA